jgi:gliding motility-associated-like protein
MAAPLNHWLRLLIFNILINKMAFIFFQRITSCLIFILLFQLEVIAQLPACKDSFPSSLLLNSSFEQYSGCNPEFGGSLEGGNIDIPEQFGGVAVNNWHPFVFSNEVSYFNYNCRSNFSGSIFNTAVFGSNIHESPKVPLPLPAGNGFIGIRARIDGYKELDTYITTCLSTPLYPQLPYVFSFYLGFGKVKLSNETSPSGSPTPFTIGIFGRDTCQDYPLHPIYDNLYDGCLSSQPGWVLLGTCKLSGKNEWVEGKIEFTPQIPISAIGIGPACTGDYVLKDTVAIYYMDQFILAPKPDFSFKNITAVSGNVCTGNFELEAPAYPNATYQWYKDRKAIPNATSQVYTVPNTPDAAGAYQANISLPYNNCINTLPYMVAFSDLQNFTLGNDTTICAPASIRLNTDWPAPISYLWQDGSEKSFYDVTQTGIYSVKVTDEYGCIKKDSIQVTIQNCNSCDLFVPNAFTPNNDGLNDVFRALPKCTNIALRTFKLRIYDRWGKLIFSSNDINDGWDGTYKNQLQSQGTYVYYLKYSFKQNPPVTKKGIINLLR